MPYTMEDYQRDYLKEHIHLVPMDDLLKAISVKDLIRGMLSESQLENVPAEDLERLRNEIDKLLKKPKE